MRKFIQQGAALLLALVLLGQTVPPAFAASETADGSVTIEAAVFPDAAFRQWLRDPANLNGYGADGVFTAQELDKITAINVSGLGIASLEGIAVFHALESLSCMNNRLTALNVRSNHNLKYLQCAFNQIDHLDVSGLDRLISLICESNGMDTLNTTGCTAMEIIYCRSNNLEAVDFSTNTALKFIETFDNRLTDIDLSNLTALEFVHLDHNRLTTVDLSHNTNLSPIGSGFVARNNHLDSLTLPVSASLLVDPDVYFEQDPKEGYERVEWYSEDTFEHRIEGPVAAQGQTLYAKWLPNDYTIYFHANGGSGSMTPQAAVWDTAVNLQANTFTRRGYTFAQWENRYGDGRKYADQQEVKNLAGEIQGDRVSLYAQWEPITYTVAFHANGGSGSMDPMSAAYDTAFSVANGFTSPSQQQEFVGWALEPGGPLVYPSGTWMQNLTDVAGQTVTLYAVWRESLSNQYITRLDKAFAAYASVDYTVQDWAALTAVHTKAVAVLKDAEEAALESITQQAEADMEGIPTIDRRVDQVLHIWLQSHADAFSQTVTEDNASALYNAARDAATGLTAELVAQSTGLSEPSDQETVLVQALEQANAQLVTLGKLADAALWAQKLDGLSTRSLDSVTSQWYAAYRDLCEEAVTHSSHLSAQLTNALTTRRDLAQSKLQAVTQLRADFDAYDLSRYSDAKARELEALFQKGLTDLESAVSSGSVSSLLAGIQAAMAAVPDKEQESKPDGGTGGGGGAAGGGGGGAAGGGGGAEPPVEEVPTPEEQPTESAVSYNDVAESAWYYAHVQYVSAKGLMLGHADGSFAPDGLLSRAQLAQILYNLEGRPAVDSSHRFEDEADGAWYNDAIAWAADQGILTGYGSGKIGPNDAITREQLATMLLRYAQVKGLDVSARGDLEQFADSDTISGYAREAMAWANGAGILTGSNGALLPGTTASRAQAAAMLTRFCTQQPV